MKLFVIKLISDISNDFWVFCFFCRFKNLVHHYQSMYPSLEVDIEDQLKKLKVDVHQASVMMR